mmetsp:Transcript_18576/g.57084  ORF Transcript_18576/g.57084 Transcript_18576/m.57084 type:complete len:377 (+) Transcript_18576:230-1360(+)
MVCYSTPTLHRRLLRRERASTSYEVGTTKRGRRSTVTLSSSQHHTQDTKKQEERYGQKERKKEEASAADEDHGTIFAGALGDGGGAGEAVVTGSAFAAVGEVFFGERGLDGLGEALVVVALAEEVAEGHGVVAEEAGLEGAVGREANAVAAAAEVVRHRRDDADAAAVEAPPARRVVGVVGRDGRQRQRRIFADRGDDFVGAHENGFVPLVRVERHPLDEADVDARPAKMPDELGELVVVLAAHDDAIHLHFEAGQRPRELDAFQNAIHRLGGPSRQSLERRGTDRVQRHVHAPQPRLVQLLDVRLGILPVRQSDAVRRHAHALHAFQRRNGLADTCEVRPQRRLAARQPHLRGAHPREEPREALDLRRRQQLRVF